MYRLFIVGVLGLGQALAQPVSAVDSRGAEVRLATPAKRVLSLAPSHTEWVFALGAGDRLVGRTPQCNHPAEAAKVPPVGNLFPPSYERIVTVRPDLVLMLGGSETALKRLESLGLKVFVWQPKTVDEVFEGARRVATLLGVDPQPALTQLKTEIDAVKPSTNNHKTAVLVWLSPATLAGPNTFAADLVRRAGGQPISVDGAGDWPRISLEQLILRQPDALVMAEGLKLPAVWTRVPAVVAGNLCRVDADLLSRPGPRLGQTLARLAACL